MSPDSIKTVAVLGAGTMGNGIAHVFARAGYRVILRDVEKRFLDRGLETISKNLDREIKKGKITAADKSAALARIHPVTDNVALVAHEWRGARRAADGGQPAGRIDGAHSAASRSRGWAAANPRPASLSKSVPVPVSGPDAFSAASAFTAPVCASAATICAGTAFRAGL